MNLSGKTLILSLALAGVTACDEQSGSQNMAAESNQQQADREAMANDPSNPYGAAEMQMHDRMMAAKGANPSETWVRKMIEHHRGAIEMSNIAIAQGGTSNVLERARMTAEMQAKEIAELERLLPGNTAPTTSAQPQASNNPSTVPAPPPKVKSTQTPKAVTPKAKAPEPDPHAGHDMANMSNTSR